MALKRKNKSEIKWWKLFCKKIRTLFDGSPLPGNGFIGIKEVAEENAAETFFI